MNDCRKRNVNVDYIKGIAILLVVLGHTMRTSTVNSENSILFNFLWSLQMPLFFLVSGYLTKYSKPIAGIGEFEKFSKKRTVGYLIPFAVWTFAVRGLIFGQYPFFNIKNLAFNMDNGYWFLFSLWTICMAYGFSCFISEKVSSEKAKSLVGISVFLLEMAILAIIALVFGMSFLCIKLTLYYMPFFYARALYGRYQDNITNFKNGNKIIELFVATSAFVYILLLLRFNTYYLSESLVEIFLRAIISLSGCCSICFAVSKLKIRGVLSNFLQYVGQHSLEIYMLHYLLISVFRLNPLPDFMSVKGFVICIGNYIITLTLTLIITLLLNSNSVLSFLLFGKTSEVFKA